MPGRMLRLSFAVLPCGFGFLGCVMILVRGPSAALLSVAMKCADYADRPDPAQGQTLDAEVTAVGAEGERNRCERLPA